ncbi:hypothetical protein TNCV_1256511 [Trichonephila clavipes]|nr:hypothetical protein TNCV_1256511 [Trichonephila clavipes]
MRKIFQHRFSFSPCDLSERKKTAWVSSSFYQVSQLSAGIIFVAWSTRGNNKTIKKKTSRVLRRAVPVDIYVASSAPWLVMLTALPLDLSSNPRVSIDACKCRVLGGTLNNRRAASPLVRLVEGEERWEVSELKCSSD